MANLPPISAAADLLFPGSHLSAGQFTFSIPTTGSGFGYGGEPNASGYAALNPAQAAAFASAIAAWDRIIAPDFTQTDDVTNPGTIRVAFTNYSAISAAFAYAYYAPIGGGSGLPIDGDIWINAVNRNQTFAPGTFEFAGLIHEIGHALGLRHPHEDPDFPANFNSAVYSIMSYEDTTFTAYGLRALPNGGIELTSSEVHAQGPMVLDIAAVQQLYGADLKTATGDDTYVFTEDSPFLLAIYDAGGNDTIDASATTRGSAIDLTPGAYSSIAAFSVEDQIAYAKAHYGASAAKLLADRLGQPDPYTFENNLGIAFSTVIENAIGGSGADTITGNAADNRLEGRGGADTLFGGAGADLLIGGVGDDRLFGGDGQDRAAYDLNSTVATWSRNADGTWTVNAGALGIDVLDGVEILKFADREIVLGAAPAAELPASSAGVTAYDFNGDGKADLLWRGADGEVALWIAGPRDAYVTQSIATISLDWKIQGAADFNGDAKADLLWRNGAGDVVVWDSQASGFTGAALGTVGLEWTIKGAGDFSGDGKADILWRSAGGDVVVWNSGASGFSGQFAGHVGAEWTIERTADFNGDGRTDILWRDTAGQVVIWNAGSGGFSGVFAGLVGQDWSVQQAADFTGDGKADVLWRNNVTGDLVMWASGAGGFTGVLAGAKPLDWSAGPAADYNGDGRADLIWTSASGEAALWLSGATPGAFTQQLLGQSPHGAQLF